MAGASTSSSSSPIRPCSPACGFSPATASRGLATPNRGSSRAVSAIVRSMSARVTSAGTSRSATWTVASTTRSAGDSNIIATNGLPVRCPSRSVCPFHGNPASANASLLTGAVAIASTSPRWAAETAATIVS